jgi:hypothetical protein
VSRVAEHTTDLRKPTSTNIDVSRYILVIHTSVFTKSNVGWREYKYLIIRFSDAMTSDQLPDKDAMTLDHLRTRR